MSGQALTRPSPGLELAGRLDAHPADLILEGDALFERPSHRQVLDRHPAGAERSTLNFVGSAAAKSVAAGVRVGSFRLEGTGVAQAGLRADVEHRAEVEGIGAG